MSDISKRRVGELLRALFDLLLGKTEGMRARDAMAALAARVAMTEYERGEYDSGGRRFDKIVRFATVDCVKAGWLVKNKGVWTVTEEGASAYRTLVDPEEFYGRASKLYREWRAANPVDPGEVDEESPEDMSSGKSISFTFEQADEQAWLEIEAYVKQMPPFEFQELVASLLRAMGYNIGWIAPPGKDGGIDIIAQVDPLGTRPPRIKVQVKRHAESKVNVEGVRSFLAVLGDGDVGIFVCVSGFTRDAEQEVRQQESRRVTLIDLERLVDLWIEYYDQVSNEARLRLSLRPIYFLAPKE